MLPVNRPVPAAVTEQQQSAGGKSTRSHSPSPQKAISSSRRTPQTTSQNSNHRAATLPLEGQGGNAMPNERKKVRPYDRPQVTIQDLLSEQQGEQSSGHVRRRPSRRSTAPPESPSSMPIDSQPFDLSELQQGQARNQVHGYLNGAGQSRTNLQNTLGDRNASRTDASGKDSRGLSVRDDDKGSSRPGVRQNCLETSRMFIVLILVYPVPDPVDGLALNVADATQEGYPNRPSRNHFRKSFRLVSRSGHLPEPASAPSPKGEAVVEGTTNNSSLRQLPGADGALPRFPSPSI